MKSRQSAKTHPPPLEPVKTLSEGITIHRFQTVSKLTPPLPLARNFSLQIEVTAIMTNDTSARLLTSLGPPAKYVFIDTQHRKGCTGKLSLSLFFERVAVSITSFRFGEKASRVSLLNREPDILRGGEGRGGGDPKDISYWPTCGCFLRRPPKENNEWY